MAGGELGHILDVGVENRVADDIRDVFNTNA